MLVSATIPLTFARLRFLQDNRIHVKHSDGRYEKVPVFSLKDPRRRRNRSVGGPWHPRLAWNKWASGVSTEEPHTCTGVIAKSCYSCFDYSNALTDLTVGYMAAPWEGVPMTELTDPVFCSTPRSSIPVYIYVDASVSMIDYAYTM